MRQTDRQKDTETQRQVGREEKQIDRYIDIWREFARDVLVRH